MNIRDITLQVPITQVTEITLSARDVAVALKKIIYQTTAIEDDAGLDWYTATDPTTVLIGAWDNGTEVSLSDPETWIVNQRDKALATLVDAYNILRSGEPFRVEIMP